MQTLYYFSLYILHEQEDFCISGNKMEKQNQMAHIKNTIFKKKKKNMFNKD